MHCTFQACVCLKAQNASDVYSQKEGNSGEAMVEIHKYSVKQ